MFYDFNIPYPFNGIQADRERIEKILERIDSFDYSTIALNYMIYNNLSDVKPIEPLSPARFKHMKQLTRATIVVEDTKRNYQLSTSSAYPQIDILAIRPTTIDTCKHACQTLEADMISLDLANSRAFPGFVAAQVAVNRGIFFEICYTQTFRDPTKKFMFFSSVKRLVEMTRGHNLIFSSEALRALEIKRPADLRVLGAMFGMTQDQIEVTLNVNYTKLLKKAETRKSTYNAAIRIHELSSSFEDKTKQNQQPQASVTAVKRKEVDEKKNKNKNKNAKKAKTLK